MQTDATLLANMQQCCDLLRPFAWALTIILNNILRIFEAKILKIFMNIQPQPQIRRSSNKKNVYS